MKQVTGIRGHSFLGRSLALRRLLRRGSSDSDKGGVPPWWPMLVASSWAENAKPSFTAGPAASDAIFSVVSDRQTGKDYTHRRHWIIDREEFLANLFAIQIEFRAEMANHLHLILQTLPRVAKRWSPREVVRRWLTATKMAKCLTDEVPPPDPKRIEKMARDRKLVAKLRRRLSSVSWFMGFLHENIAQRANDEDGCHGRFWESRFKCRECTDQNALLLCAIYVDLNPYRAGEVDDPLGSPYTSVHLRMRAQALADEIAGRPDDWMGELTEQPESLANEQLGLHVTDRSSRL